MTRGPFPTASFPPVPASARAARRFVLQAAGDAPADPRDAIAVMVAELAMNAVQHARTDFDDWGIIPAPRGSGKSVWFQIRLPAPPRNTGRLRAGAPR